METNKVFIVLTEYNDLDSDLTLVGVYDSQEATIEGVRKNIKNYISECYTEEDIIINTGFDNEDEMIDSIINTLIKEGKAIDPMDDLKVWYHSNPEIEHLDYEGKIREMLENKHNSILILEDIKFFPMPFDGSNTLVKSFSLQSAPRDKGKNAVVINDVEGDWWLLEDQPLHKQKELYDKLKENNLL